MAINILKMIISTIGEDWDSVARHTDDGDGGNSASLIND